ncbi:MAG: aminopeptidase [Clostridia bacterium]|nr:aminopeptidase [Clostridia bacterium]
MYQKNVWEGISEEKKQAIFAFNEGYKAFLSAAKTERLAVKESEKLAKKAGFKRFDEYKKLAAGDKVYFINRDKNIILYIIGKKPLEEGMNVLGAHIDSPRLDLKQNPLYECKGMAFMDTHYYGGVKKYQYVTLPLALHGVVYKKDGTKVEIAVGENDDEPVLGINDLLPHLAQEQMKGNAATFIEGEKLDLTVGSIPMEGDEKEAVKANVLKILTDKYGIDEEDLVSAEIEVVPAGKARDFGLDRSMVMSYGQDDRVCAYASLIAILETEAPEYTACCELVDKEEIGSVGATGAHSVFFENTVAELLNKMGRTDYIALKRAMENSKMLSSDVSAALDPLYPSVSDENNCAKINYGVVFNKYTGARGKSGANDAMPEFIAYLRKLLDDEDIYFQTGELGKVDAGGGGTIAYILAKYNMSVIDAGVPVLSMHAPWEVTAKADVYEAYRCYKAFVK